MPSPTIELIRTIEEASLNAWPALQQILYDGWILRFANGHTKRANSVNPVYQGSKNAQEKIKQCQAIYASKNLPTIFRITPLAYPENLDVILEKSGFEKKDISSVQLKNLESFKPQTTATIRSWTDFSQEWLDFFATLRELPVEEQEALKSLLNNIASEKLFSLLVKNNQVVSCGLGVLDNQCIGLFEITTARNQQRKGYAKELILNILSWAKNKGATKAYLQVLATNEVALNLYAKLGFQEVYQYFYRIEGK